jgi:NAD(P)-dependent dehydrogenase (short-subunit alcohol dehydrogenase family)
MRIIVIDGMGGGIGAELCGRLREFVGNAGGELIALGTNSAATERMLKAGAQRGATGENAIKVTAGTGDFITGPIGIIIRDSMMGEITSPMADAVLSAPGERVLLPLQNEHFYLAGLGKGNLGKLIDEAVDYIRGKMIAFH